MPMLTVVNTQLKAKVPSMKAEQSELRGLFEISCAKLQLRIITFIFQDSVWIYVELRWLLSFWGPLPEVQSVRSIL